MDKKNAKEAEIKRTPIAPGIFMDKYREKTPTANYYVIKVELKLFQVLEITIDFTNSKNIKVEGSDSLDKTTIVQPFQYQEVARLVLNQGWSLKTKINFSITLPELAVQKKFLEGFEHEIDKSIKDFNSYRQMDFINIPEAHLSKFFKSNNLSFIDFDFLPNYSSIGMTEKNCSDKFEALVHWKKLNTIIFSEDQERTSSFPLHNLETPAHPTDVKSGKLDNLITLSAIASLAEKENQIESIMESKIMSSHGLLKIKLYEFGKEVIFLVDDFFPCFPLGEPIFGSNFSKSYWVLMLEKAMAKKYNGYSNLRKMSFLNAIVDLTGSPSFSHKIPSLNVQNNQKLTILWDSLTVWLQSKFIVAADTKKLPADPAHKEFDHQCACTIVHATARENLRLVNLRNQFGVMEWEGDWSYQSPLWTNEMISYFLPDMSGDDETIWMSYEDFVQNFENITVCKTAKWNREIMIGQFITSVDEENNDIHHVCSRNYYQVEIFDESTFIVGVHQEDASIEATRNSRPYLDIGVTILKKENDSYQLVQNFENETSRQIFLETKMSPGIYLIVPKSSGLDFKRQKSDKLSNWLNYSRNDGASQLIISDIFRKLNVKNDEYLSFEEFSKFYKKISKKLTEEDFKILLNIYSKKNLDISVPKGFTKKQFFNHFFDLFDTQEEALKVFRTFGYNENLFSSKSRIFGLTFHSSLDISIKVLDALSANIDYINNKLLIKLQGQNVREMGGTKFLEDSGIVPRVLLNE